jgi:hypothetical protein
LLGFKKSVDDKSASFQRCPARASRCFAIDHCGPGIDRQQGAIWERYPAAVRNAAWIDRAVSGLQTRARGANMPRKQD